MKTKKSLILLLALMSGLQMWGYRITDNYTIETKFKINAVGAGIMFANYNGYNGDFYMWQFNVGVDGTKSLFRPHHWNPGALLEEKGTGDVTLNTTDWFVTIIEVTNGSHADTYLRRADDAVDVLIDSRDGDFRYGMIGFRQDHDGSLNESASFDYFKITDEDGGVLYYDDFNDAVSWQNDPVVADGCLTAEGRNLSEVRYRPNNMFADAVDMHYAVEADMTIDEGYLSLVFGLGDNGSNYMWQFSTNYYNDGSVNIYYHLDNGSESWKAHAAGPRFPDFTAEDFKTPRHVMIKVDGNIVSTYVDGLLQDKFVQCDMTDLERLNDGGIGLRADASNNINHRGTIDNVKVTHYDAEGNVERVDLYDNFTGNLSRYFEVDLYDFITVEDEKIKIDVPAGGGAVRILQTDSPVNPLVLDEAADNTGLPALPATEVRFDRSFKANTWNTLCVPFSLSAEQVSALLGEGAKVAALTSFDADDVAFQFNSVSDVAAYEPYLVYPSQDVTTTNLTVDLTEGVAASRSFGDYAFTGILAPKALTADDKTVLFVSEGNKLTRPAVDSSLKAFRCFFTIPEDAPEAKYYVDGELTAVHGIDVPSVAPAEQVFDLQGRPVQSAAMAKGVYIVDGKKVIK